MNRRERKKAPLEQQSPPMGSQSHSDPHNPGGREQKRDVSGNIHVRGEVEVKVPVEVEKKRNSDEEKRDARDKKRLVVEVLTLLFVVVYAGLTGFLVYFTNGQLKQARTASGAATQSADTAQKEYVMSQRPWVSLEVTGQQLTISTGMPAFIKTNITMKNVGHSIAENVMFYPHLIDRAHETGKECDYSSKDRAIAGQHDAGMVIFPERGAEVTDIPAVMWPPNSVDSTSGVRLIGCVNYISPIDNTFHYTRMAYWVSHEESPNSYFQPIPGVQQITLTADINGESAD